jgi:hypothetical protein
MGVIAVAALPACAAETVALTHKLADLSRELSSSCLLRSLVFLGANVIGADPVRVGLVASINRPGGNITGVVFSVALVAKLLGMLHQLVPQASTIAVLRDPNGVTKSFFVMCITSCPQPQQ